MIVMSTGDNHCNERSRFEEFCRVHGWIAEQVEKENPDVFVDPGDLYDAASSPREREWMADWLTRIAEVCPVLITKGNHDEPKDCELLGKLRTKHPIIVEEACGVHVLGGIAIAAVAWPSLGNLSSMLGRQVNATALDEIARDELCNVFRGLGTQLDGYDMPRLLAGHFMVNGSRTGAGQPLIGAQLNVSLSDLGLVRAQMTIMSHIHAAQDWSYNGAPIAYCGSSYATDYGEPEAKSILIADITRKGLDWSRLLTPATPLLLMEGAWDPALGALSVLGDSFSAPKGADIRLKYTVDSDQRDAAKIAVRRLRDSLLAFGAVAVKPEEVVNPAVRARTPEIALATTLPEKVRTVWRAKGINISEARDSRLMAKLAEIHS